MVCFKFRYLTLSLLRDYRSCEGASGEGGPETQANLTPHEQHQQYLGERRPELDPFPDLDWEQHPIPGKATIGYTWSDNHTVVVINN